jgi:sugar phosphate isomerase/epimerase
MYTRRQFALTALAAAAAGPAYTEAIRSRFGGVQLGVQSYSFREMPLDHAIAAMQSIGIGECELYTGHVEPAGVKGEALTRWRLQTPLSHFHDVRKKFDNAGIALGAYSLNFRDHFSDVELDRGLQITRALGTDIVTTSTTLTCAKRLVPLAEKNRVRVAMHGHDETNKPNEFSSPESFARALAMSPLFYINLDIGHFSSAGFDPVSYIEQHHAKILTLHIKDRKKNHGPAVAFGQGDTPIREVLLLLKAKHYDIPANIEYEYNEDNPGLDTVAEVRRCFDYCKKILS